MARLVFLLIACQCCFFSPSSLVLAQKVSGKISDGSTKLDVPFANVVVLGEAIGTVSDEDGVFELEITEGTGVDSLIFSCLGYHSDTLSVKFLSRNKYNRIFLHPKQHELPLVEISPKHYRKKTLGNKIKRDFGVITFDDRSAGYEIGVQMKTHGKLSWIDSVHIRFTECLTDSVFFRMNIYEFFDGNPNNSLLNAPIYIDISPGSINTFSIDLQRLKLKTKEDFLVSLELLRDQSESQFSLSTGLFTAPTFFRLSNQDQWHKNPFGVNIAAFVKQEK